MWDIRQDNFSIFTEKVNLIFNAFYDIFFKRLFQFIIFLSHIFYTMTMNFVDYLKSSNSWSIRLNLTISQSSSFLIALSLSTSYSMSRSFWPFSLHPIASFQSWNYKSILWRKSKNRVSLFFPSEAFIIRIRVVGCFDKKFKFIIVTLIFCNILTTSGFSQLIPVLISPSDER